MVRVRCRTAGSETQVVTANYAIGIATANASRRFSGNAAGAHRADAAAQALLANLAVGTLSSSTSLVGVRANKLRRLKKTGCRSFHLLVRNKNVPRQRTTSTLFFSQQTRLRILPTFPHGKYLGQIIEGFEIGQVSDFYLQLWLEVKIVLLNEISYYSRFPSGLFSNLDRNCTILRIEGEKRRRKNRYFPPLCV